MTRARAPRTGIAVFSRFDSRRLPGKALHPIAGRPLLCRVLDRVRRVPDAVIIVATSDRPVDDIIATTARAEGVEVFRGSLDDVAGRALACGEAYGLERLVRISGDSPFIPPDLIATMLHRPEADTDTLVTNVMPRTFPPGASIEVMGMGFLRALLAAPLDAQDREHVTRYAYAHPDRFRIVNHAVPDRRYQGVTLTLDEPHDLVRTEAVIRLLGTQVADADLDAVTAAARAVGSVPC